MRVVNSIRQINDMIKTGLGDMSPRLVSGVGSPPYIRWNRETPNRSGGHTGIPRYESSHHLYRVDPSRRWNVGPGALTLLGVFAIALALILPDSITPYLALASPPLAKSDTFVNLL